ncbi:formylglycine-generating enzyme family protein [Bacteroides muris (ex Fokt et al. 2023)]|uniref:Formylglycine-generating enzyme family protein n=1 Tax=Bacteroides muris (ex Fokt et al. 2023) TaxID=2937417 RepID=A0A9X2SSE6_9BACE|nr:formylglycine-generating enzyme family protein [Bacteroides muris (ex Fokt et al. 2023)]MCR6503808.1 formylglycine-generating enzyme family protein [Bacteroides muris (ex Fokt et al. 2023)]
MRKNILSTNRINYLVWSLALSCLLACSPDKSNQEPVPTLTFTVNGESFEMVLVEGGTFQMGGTREQGSDCEDNEKPVHEEEVDSFYIGKYEVTQRLWNAVIGSEHNSSFNAGCDDCPVESVSWEDAQAFITKLSILTKSPFRLPTEKEWEYAARGGKRSQGYKYSGSHNIGEVAWYIDNYQTNPCGEEGTTHPVGIKKPNELGIYDMSGNVWEWCEDLYTKEYEHNGKSVHSGWPFKGTHLYFRRVLRGGSWGGTAKGCRVSYIDYDMGSYKDEYGGFRIALDGRREEGAE